MIPYGRHNVTWGDALKVFWQVRFRSLTQGNQIEKFEEQMARYVGAKYAVAVSSATAGLHLAAISLRLPKESKVITSPISFVASSNSLLYANYKPVFVDVDDKTLNMNVDLVESKVKNDKKIRAILPVHFAGLACDMKRIHDLATKHDLRVIEDAAHALGASYESGDKVGSCQYSDMTVLSFHPVKSITTGEGGIITTNDYALYKTLLRLRSHGINKLDDEFQNPILSRSASLVNPWYYEMIELGFNYRMTEIQAVLGISQLKRLDKFMSQRKRKVQKYRTSFQNVKNLRPAQSGDSATSANHIFPVRIDFAALGISRAELMASLREKQIGTQVHYIPIPLQPYYQALGYEMGEMPEALSYYQEALTLPLFPDLKHSEQIRVVFELSRILDNR